MLVVTLDGWKTQFSAHEEFLPAAKLLDLPDDSGLLGSVVYGSDVGSESWRVRVFRYGNDDLNVVSRAAAFELGFGLRKQLVRDDINPPL